MEFIIKIVKVSILMLIVYPISSLSAETDYKISTVENLTLKSVDFFGAEIEVDFYSIEDRASLNRHLSGSIKGSTGFSPARIRGGANKVSIYVTRNMQKPEGYISSTIKIFAYEPGASFHYKKDHELLIHWPSEKSLYKNLSVQSSKKPDLSDIQKISINRNHPNSDEILKSLLQNGFSALKISLFNAQNYMINNVDLDKQIASQSAQNLLQIVTNAMESVPFVKFTSKINKVKKYTVTIGSKSRFRGNNLLTKGEFNKLKNPDLTKQAFLKIFNLTPPTLAEKTEALYQEAYLLIDSENKFELQRAKNKLEELIRIDPNFARAYLELARYQMRVDWPRGLLKAEKLILTAVEIDPKLADARVLLGYVYTNIDKFETAEKEYVLAEKLGTDNLWLNANWGLNYEKQGKDLAAIEKYQKVLNAQNKKARDNRPKEWVYTTSRLFPMLINSQQYQMADSLFEKSAKEFYSLRCHLQRQASLRLYIMNDADKAIDSYFKSKENGCKYNSSVLSAAYFLKWSKLKDSPSNPTAMALLRQAEAAAPNDAALFYALAHSELTARIIPDLIKKGYDINYVNNEGSTALLVSIASGDVLAAKRLINNGADINLKIESDYSIPIVYSIYNQNEEMVKLLLSEKVNTNITIEKTMTLSDFASQVGLSSVSGILENLPET